MRSSKQSRFHSVLDVIHLDTVHLDVIGYHRSGNIKPSPRVRLTDGGAYLIDTDGKLIID